MEQSGTEFSYTQSTNKTEYHRMRQLSEEHKSYNFHTFLNHNCRQLLDTDPTECLTETLLEMLSHLKTMTLTLTTFNFRLYQLDLRVAQ